jgi:hypothetical protein
MGSVERPLLRNTFELVFAAVRKAEAGTGHEIPDGARREHLPGLRERSDASRDVHSDASELVTTLFAFTGMDANTKLNTNSPGRFGQSEGALHGPSWAVECSKVPVACCGHLPAAKTLQLTSHDLVMPVEHLPPTPVAQFGRSAGGIDDVRVEQRRQNPIGIRAGSMPSEELLDLVDEPVDITGEDETVIARKLYEFGPGDVRGDIAALVYRDEGVVGAVHHEGRDPDC